MFVVITMGSMESASKLMTLVPSVLDHGEAVTGENETFTEVVPHPYGFICGDGALNFSSKGVRPRPTLSRKRCRRSFA